MGGSLAKAIKHFSPCYITAIEADPISAKLAKTEGSVDAFCSLCDLPASVELVFVCTPMSRVKNHIKQLLIHCSSETLISDIASAKAYLAKENFPDRVILGHPIAGKETAGYASAETRLFDKRSYVLIPPKNRLKGYEKLKELIESIGAVVIECSAAHHDKQLALSSHFPYFAAKAALNTTQKCELDQAFIGPGFESFTRLAHSQATWAKDITRFNKEEIVCAIESYQQSLSLLLKELQI